MRHIFIVGSKGIPAKYGGFETFVDELVTRKQSSDIKYHVACMGEAEKPTYHGADCFGVKVPNVGPAKAVLYDLKAIKVATKIAKEQNITDGVLYILACRIGPFMRHAVKRLRKRGFKVYVNPDGHEWMRAKWNALIKKYWKWSEGLMVKNADLLICDSKNIEKYIKTEYKKYSPKTMFIPYGADTTKSKLADSAKELNDWYKKQGVSKKEYYLVLGRFVPENNYETMIREFMKSNTKKDLVLVTDIEENKFYKKLLVATGFDKDTRIKFVGTVYDKELVKKIRENSFAYVHGHSVGGTNPSLLEALASTDINILYDCGFNREVAEDGAWYFGISDGNLAKLIDEIEGLTTSSIEKVKKAARQRIDDEYEWGKVVGEYEGVWGANRKIKIMYLHAGAELYGSDRILLSIVSRLNKEIFEPIVILPNDGPLVDELRKAGIDVRVLPYPIIRRKYFNPRGVVNYLKSYRHSCNDLLEIIGNENIDIVHNNTIAVLEGISLRRRTSVRLVSHVHEMLERPKFIVRILYKMHTKYADKVICVSDAVKNNIQMLVGSRANLVTIHNGIVAIKQKKSNFRRNIGIPEGARLFAVVGRVNAVKGQEDFIAAMESARFSNSNKEQFGVIVGDAFSGQEWRVEKLKRLLDERRVSRYVKYTGFVKDMTDVYSAMDCLVLPSVQNDSFPTVVLEAMSCGVPTIAYKSGGVEEMIKSGVNGYLVERNDIEALSKTLKMDFPNNMREKCLRIFERKFEIDKFMYNITNLYLGLSCVGKEKYEE